MKKGRFLFVNKKLKDINLLAAYQFEKKTRSNTIKIFILLLVLEITVLALLSSINTTKITGLKKEIMKLESQISNQQKRITDVKKITEQVRLADEKQKLIDDKYNQHMAMLNTLNKLEKIIPKSVIIQSLTISSDKVSFTAKSDSLDALFQFLLNIQTDSYFKNVSYSNITVSDNLNVFTLSADIQRK